MGTISALLAGLVAPMFGVGIMKNLSQIMTAQIDPSLDVLEAIAPWIVFMIGLAIGLFATKAVSVMLFGKVGQNIIMGVRKELYTAALRKEIGWHDDRENSAGVITATLASDVQALSGVSSEGSAALLEATAAFFWGLILAFIYSWPMALVGLVAGPLMGIASYVQTKVDNDMYFAGDVEKGNEDERTKASDTK